MKIRLGFVSNSSSSSFVVAIKGKVPRIRLTIDLDEMDLSPILVSTKKELEKYVDDHHMYCSDEEKQEYLNKFLDRINKGEKIYFYDFSSDSESVLSRLLYYKKDLIELIEGELMEQEQG